MGEANVDESNESLSPCFAFCARCTALFRRRTRRREVPIRLHLLWAGRCAHQAKSSDLVDGPLFLFSGGLVELRGVFFCCAVFLLGKIENQ